MTKEVEATHFSNEAFTTGKGPDDDHIYVPKDTTFIMAGKYPMVVTVGEVKRPLYPQERTVRVHEVLDHTTQTWPSIVPIKRD